MGFISRRVLPACGSVCVFCPALRTRSRQPVKRYKKLIADVFQEEHPNDRKISKLCDYAVKNPFRLPKIAAILEQRCYKALRTGQVGVIRAVTAVYIKLFSICKDQMPLLALSSINMIRALLDENQPDDLRILGCTLIFEFVYNQVDGTYIYQIDALLSNVCCLAKELGEERRQRQLRSAGLRALSALIWFMGKHLHLPVLYTHVVSVIMDNYIHPFMDADRSIGAVEIPSVWAELCVEKISQFCQEATTTRRFLEPFLYYFDVGKHWSPVQGLALKVLQQILHFIERFGNDSFVLVVLVRHLEHKAVKEDLQVKCDILSVAASLARQSKSRTNTIEIGTFGDALRHLRNTLISMREASLQHMLGDYTNLQLAIQKFISEIVKKINCPAPIFETMALTIDMLPSSAHISQSTMHSLLILGSIMASQPISIPTRQFFPEALLQQLALAMTHPDSDTRFGAHQVFETILSSLLVVEEEEESSTLSDQRPISKMGFPSGATYNFGQMQRRVGKDMDFNIKLENVGLMLSDDQVGLLFSAIWREMKLDNNMPRNYQASLKTFTLTLQLSSARISKDTFTWSFQLSLSLRTMATQMDGHLSSCRRRSLFLLSSAMLIFVAKFYNLTEIEDEVKAFGKRSQISANLEFGSLIMDQVEASQYGTPADNTAASSFLDQIRKEIELSNESLVSVILTSSSTMYQSNIEGLRKDLNQTFSPIHDGFMFNLDGDRPRPWTAFLQKSISFDEVNDNKDDLSIDTGCANIPKSFSGIDSSESVTKPLADVMGVTQLLRTALEMAGQVAKAKTAESHLPFSAMAMQCQDFASLARRKTLIWRNVEDQHSLDHKESGGVDFLSLSKFEDISHQTLQLPPVSHYDNFLRAAGC